MTVVAMESEPIVQVVLCLAVILIVGKVVSAFCRRIGQPVVIGEIIAGNKPPLALAFTIASMIEIVAAVLLARRFSTLDHLTRGRVSWNVVTGHLPSAAKAASS